MRVILALATPPSGGYGGLAVRVLLVPGSGFVKYFVRHALTWSQGSVRVASQ